VGYGGLGRIGGWFLEDGANKNKILHEPVLKFYVLLLLFYLWIAQQVHEKKNVHNKLNEYHFAFGRLGKANNNCK